MNELPINRSTLKENLHNANTWIRGAWMLLFIIVYEIAAFVIGLLAIVQFVLLLTAGTPHSTLLSFSQRLNAYVYQIINYLIYATEERPFPFSSFPKMELPSSVMYANATLDFSNAQQFIRNYRFWLRGCFMLVFALIHFFVLEYIMYGIIFFQFGSVLFVATANEALKQLAKSLCAYIYQIISYLTFNSDEKPFPFSRLPAL
ncbi:DUF4389 domain-containing protein [Beggiatoa leptomitoformis]|uniref:DUF4389 domain-containing protein n=1 Tax=Beggiatoa leptomitoformis TaxID=288004 RepID=A0A2N9YG26_9GAMM|nr:DUF4389 domain-containing protein [Beggiatoa leptomitoformis]AUI69454.1 DUF4389 domain-containing protein [Beggiatoa leptomitoformis]QGX03711.1 DUF4389 domain-containing protein [Beggiatoa leptomitoformis]